jgi:hypothetical protein
MVHMFHLDVAKVDLVLHMLQWLMLQVYVSNVSAVSNICCKCFIWILHICWNSYTYVASVRFICFRRMLQVFYLDVPSVSVAIHVCCKRLFKMFQLFQTYVASVFI